MDPRTRLAAERLRDAIEAEFKGVRVIIDPAVADPDAEHAYLWLDGAHVSGHEYADAWEHAHLLADKLWQKDDILFIVKKRNAPDAPAGDEDEG
jgi:hypothetical protein